MPRGRDAEPCKFRTAPAPENYPGSEKNVPTAPGPAPGSMYRLRQGGSGSGSGSGSDSDSRDAKSCKFVTAHLTLR